MIFHLIDFLQYIVIASISTTHQFIIANIIHPISTLHLVYGKLPTTLHVIISEIDGLGIPISQYPTVTVTSVRVKVASSAHGYAHLAAYI